MPPRLRTSVQFYRSLINSDHRLTYGFVDGVLEAGRRERGARGGRRDGR